jgi:3-oxoacyl-[acyl-carrier protein] reductase
MSAISFQFKQSRRLCCADFAQGSKTRRVDCEERWQVIDPGLQGRTVLITGANHGIGAATARKFASEGAKVFVTFFRETSPYTEQELRAARAAGRGGDRFYRSMQQQSAEALIEEIRGAGGVATAREADLSQESQIPSLFDTCEAELGAVEVLINNHTHCVHETFDPSLASGAEGVSLVSAASIDRHFTVNARGYALLMAEYVKRYLARRGTRGRIINVSTDASHAHPGNVNYSASKHAIESYSRSAAVELGKYEITVNVVAPGPTQTGYIAPEDEGEIAQKTPLRRVGRPEDVADVLLFLASEQARWLTGQLIYVGGGWRMHQ